MLAFLLPAAAVPRLVHGLNGWVRHLPTSGVGNRRGLAVALVAVQLPLTISLALLGLVAYGKGQAVALPGMRLSLLLAAVPTKRHFMSAALSLGGAALVVSGAAYAILPAAGLLAVADLVAGPLHQTRRSRTWRPVGALFRSTVQLPHCLAISGGEFLRTFPGFPDSDRHRSAFHNQQQRSASCDYLRRGEVRGRPGPHSLPLGIGRPPHGATEG